MTITVLKIGDGTENNPFRPETNSEWWQVIKERESEFDIKILDNLR